MRSIPRSGSERRAESFSGRRYHHVDKSTKGFRLAGELFGTELRDRARSAEKEARQRLQSARPVGLGFGERDNYGPDNSWDTKDPISYTPVPGYYKV